MALDAAGVPSDLTLVPGAGHGWDDEIEQADMVVFFQTRLGEVLGLSGNGLEAGFEITAPIRLLPSRPNPFRDDTTVRLETVEPTPVVLEIHDVHGRMIRTLPDAPLDSGLHCLVWNGRDEAGRKSSGRSVFSAGAIPLSLRRTALAHGEMIRIPLWGGLSRVAARHDLGEM